jgi:hypothetical protein
MTDPRGTVNPDGTPADRRQGPWGDWRTWALVLLACAFIATAGATISARSAADEARDAAIQAHRALAESDHAIRSVRRVERRDRRSARTAALRLCTRNRADRAFAHARLRGLRMDGVPVPPANGAALPPGEYRVRLSRALMDQAFIPLLDCRPNIRGRGAGTWSIADQERFLRRFVRRELAPGELGICPGSKIGDDEPAAHC